MREDQIYNEISHLIKIKIKDIRDNDKQRIASLISMLQESGVSLDKIAKRLNTTKQSLYNQYKIKKGGDNT